MAEAAVFNQPIDPAGTRAIDSPIFHEQKSPPIPIRERSKTRHDAATPSNDVPPSRRSSERPYSIDTTVGSVDGSSSQTRQRRRLTKSNNSSSARGNNSEANPEKSPVVAGEKAAAERTKGLLVKKQENQPLTAGAKDDDNKRGSFSSQGSSLRDKIFPPH